MKKFLILMLILALAMVIASCGSNETTNDNGDTNNVDTTRETEAPVPFELPDLKIAAEYMVMCMEMTDMTDLDADSLMLRYGILDKYTDAYAIVSASIASDECVIFKANDEAAAEEIVELLKTYRDERVALYNGYAPEEAPRLESAFIRAKNGYVAFVATTDPVKAEEVWERMPAELGG